MSLAEATSPKFLSAIEDVLTSASTTPVVKSRVLEVLSGAAHSYPGPPTVSQGLVDAFKKDKGGGYGPLWRRVKPASYPDEVCYRTLPALASNQIIMFRAFLSIPLIRCSARQTPRNLRVYRMVKLMQDNALETPRPLIPAKRIRIPITPNHRDCQVKRIDREGHMVPLYNSKSFLWMKM